MTAITIGLGGCADDAHEARTSATSATSATSGAVAPVASVRASVASSSSVASGSSVAPPSSPPAQPSERVPVVLDYSPTLSDAGALLFLASHPGVELLAVTLPGTGEADCEPGADTTRSLLAAAGHSAVPVGCGRDTPLAGDRDWPDAWRAEANGWATELLPAADPTPTVDAEQLLVDTLIATTTPITLVAVGPLTNVGAVLVSNPELAERIERIVIMGGAVTVSGNVESAPAAEWNLYIDPEAARHVIASGVAVTFVPLDATNHVPWTERLLRRLADLDGQAAAVVHSMATSRDSLTGFFLWDELAAIVAIDPTVVVLEPMRIAIDDDGATVIDPAGSAVDVAVTADADAATDELLRILNGGRTPDVVELTAAERAYLVDVAGADTHLNAALGRAYASTANAPDGDARGAAAAFIDDFVDAVDAVVEELGGLTPPPSLASAHADYVSALTEFVATRDELIAAVEGGSASGVDLLIDEAMTAISADDLVARIRDACQALEDFSFLRGGPRPCSSAAGD